MDRTIVKIFGAGVLVILVAATFTAIGASTEPISVGRLIEGDVYQATSNTAGFDVSTHTVFGELGTATWCGYCKYAHGALKEIWNDGLYDFYYVSMVDDKDTHASNRIRSNYNIYGFPTVWFDGGYKVTVGAGSIPSAKAAYINSINSCGSRIVPDIDAVLSVKWLGDAKMDITVSVKNNEANPYEGTVRVYVTECVSTMGWKDSAGHPYTFPFLDYAFNEPIVIDAGSTWQDSTIWDGYQHNDGHGHNFGGITANNTMVIAAVFNAEWHQGYSYPPGKNPFDAYYVDEVTGEMPAIVVDDSDSEFLLLSGGWHTASLPNAWNGNTHYIAKGSGNNRAAWRIDGIIDPGMYDVYTYKFEHPYLNLMATNAPYVVYYNTGQSSVITVDQSTPGNEWIYLGAWDFDNSHAQGVLTADYANGFVAADAIKLVHVRPTV